MNCPCGHFTSIQDNSIGPLGYPRAEKESVWRIEEENPSPTGAQDSSVCTPCSAGFFSPSTGSIHDDYVLA